MDSHRESCRRQHRVLGHFLAVQAWLRKLDCLALERRDLEVYLGLKRFKSERVEWLKADLKPWFPFQERFGRTGRELSLHSLFISRVPISKWLSELSMNTAKRIQAMSPDAPKTALFSNLKEGDWHIKETDVVRYLAVLDSGLSEPKPLSCVPSAA